MSYQWPLDSQSLFGERFSQILNFSNFPRKDVEGVRDAIKEMWPHAASGWEFEWSKLAKSYSDAGKHAFASAAYGWAKFPCLADENKRAAQDNQLKEYLLAAPNFGIDFERQVLELPYQGRTTKVPVHILTPFDVPEGGPVLIASGGVDTWKMDIHENLVKLATRLRIRVLAFDIAGTGESSVAMTSIVPSA